MIKVSINCFHFKGIASGRFLYLRARSPVSATEATIDGPTFEPDKGCYMTFWLDMEGTGTGKGTITIYAQNLQNSTTSVIYQTWPYMFPSRMFGYARHVVQFSGLTYRFRVLLKGIKMNAHNLNF